MRVGVVAVPLLVLVSIAVLLPNHPAGRDPAEDTGVFFYAAQRLLDGGVPYRDIWDHKPPGVYFVDAVGLALAGRVGIWVVQIAPMLCALTMAMLNAPGIALQLTEREAAGEFTGADPRDLRTRSALAAHLCVPLIVAHAAVCVACTFLVVLFVLALGLLAQLVLAVGDVRNVADLVFARVSPVMWLHTALSAWGLGLVCVLSAVVYAWPGTQITQRGLDAHRLGLRAMMVSAIACVVAGLAFNWVAVLLGWSAVG